MSDTIDHALWMFPGILADVQIHACVSENIIGIEPFLMTSVQPASYDLRLGPELLIATPDGSRPHNLQEQGPLWIYKDSFVLASTLEIVTLPATIVGDLSGKSSLARRGLQVEAAGYVDPGWHGRLTLELIHFHPQPIQLLHGMPICQITFHRMSRPADRLYGSPELGSHYQGSTGPVEGVVFGTGSSRRSGA